MRVAVYARLSKAQGDALGIDRQLELCRKVAATSGWDVVEEFTDHGRSAYTRGLVREGYEALLALVSARRVDTVLAYHVDRLFRQDRERLRFYDLLTEAGVHSVLSVDGSDYDLRTADGRRAFRDAGSAAEYASDRQSERLRRKHDEIAEAGRWQGGGRRPFGYDVVGPKPFRLRVNRKEARFIREAMNHIIRGGSLHRLVVDWNEGRRTTPSGNRWTLTDMRRVLLSPQVAGIRVHRRGGTVVGEYDGDWKAILSRDEHELLKATMGDPARRTAGFSGKREASTGRRHPLTGLIRCGECGMKLAGKRATGKARSYACTSAQAGCGRVAIVAYPLERWLARQVLIHEIAEVRSGSTPGRFETTSAPNSGADDTAVLAELRDVQDRINRLAEDYADGMLTAQQLRIATQRLDTRRAELTAQLAHGHPTEQKRPIRVGDIYTADDVYDALGADPRPRMRELGIDPAVPTDDEFRERWRVGTLTPSEVLHLHEEMAASVERVTIARAAKVGGRFDSGRVEVAWR